MTTATPDLTSFAGLARLLSEESIRANERAKATHARFNLFTTLLKIDDEERLHTRFLHSLLNPEGLHDCGPLFLTLFWETLNELPPTNHTDKPVTIQLAALDSTWTVMKEASRPPHGNLDILLERAGHGVAIENKIYAAEQPRQLARYAEYLAATHPPSGRTLIYLTRNGVAGTSHEDADYLRISYRVHILAWLEKCLRETYAMPAINHALQQYRTVVRKLTINPLDTVLMKTATEYIFRNPDIIRHRQAMIQAVDEARIQFLDSLAKSIGAHFSERFQPRIYPGQHGLGRSTDSSIFLQPAVGDLLADAPFKITLQYWTDKQQLLLGVDIGLEKAPVASGLLDRMRQHIEANIGALNYAKASKSYPNWPTGWLVLIESLSDSVLADEIQHPTITKPECICAAIASYIELLTSAYNEALKTTPSPVTA